MRHDLTISGWRFALRPVEVEDAAFIVRLRTDPKLGRFIHPTSHRVEDQIAWIEAYLQRRGDYYFMIEDTRLGRPVGAISIYEMSGDGREAEWGRWVIEEGSLAAVESVALMYRIAFEQLGVQEVYSRTVADNAQVVSFHDSSGARRVGLRGQDNLGGVMYHMMEHRVDAALWPELRPRLDTLARALASR